MLLNFITDNKVEYKHVCGVPYTALPIATLVSIRDQKPMLIRRKEVKAYGTKKLIEGKFGAGDTCLIIEDIITSGSSILETVADLHSEGTNYIFIIHLKIIHKTIKIFCYKLGIVVNDSIVVIDREQGGAANISNNNINVHSLFKISQFLDILKEANRIDDDTVQTILTYIKNNQAPAVPSTPAEEMKRTKLTYESRIELAKSPVAKDLLRIIVAKKTNLCLAADTTKSVDILNAAEVAGPYICILKTHVDIIDDFNDDFVRSLQAIAVRHNFLIMEDRKFADIGNTVSLQYSSGVFRISDWANLVTG